MRLRHRYDTCLNIFVLLFIFSVFSGVFMNGQSYSGVIEDQSILEKGKNHLYNQKYDQAKKILTPLANDNDREAQYYLAQVYRAQKQFDKAFTWFKKSGDNGNSQAYFQMGLMHDNGEGVEMNPLNAMDWYRKAKLSEINSLSDKQAKFYDDNQNGTLKQVTANTMLEKQKQVAENGDVEAQYIVAQRLDFGIFVPRNFAEAIKWYQRAAENGHKESQFQLGYFFCRGVGVEQNKKLANEWLIKSGRKPYCKY
jgi:TPR repeat protein